MAGRPKGRKAETKAERDTGKVTLTLSVETIQRLGVEASIRRVSMSKVAEEVLAPYLKRWRLPSTIAPDAPAAESAGDAA